MKYTIVYEMNSFESDSRDAKKHARNLGKEVKVYKGNKLVSWAKLDPQNNPYSCFVGK